MEILAREYKRNTLGNLSFVRVLLGVVKYPGRDWELRRLEATTVRIEALPCQGSWELLENQPLSGKYILHVVEHDDIRGFTYLFLGYLHKNFLAIMGKFLECLPGVLYPGDQTFLG